MSRKNRVIILPIALAILALFSFYGCGTIAGAPDATTTPAGASTQSILNEQQATQILIDSMTNYQNINTYKYNLSMDMLVDITAEGKSGTVTMLLTSDGAMNTAQNLMQMNMEMVMNADIPDEQNTSQEVTSEIYIMADYMYMKIVIPQGEQWVKVPISETIKDQLDLDTVDEQMGIAENPLKTECLRIENVGGVDCYVLAVTPNASEMDDWLDTINSSLGDMGVDEIANNADVIKDFSYLCYVAVDSHKLMKSACIATLGYSAEQFGGSYAVESMTISYNLVMNLYDHNVPFTITVPDEAQNAMELSEDIFLN